MKFLKSTIDIAYKKNKKYLIIFLLSLLVIFLLVILFVIWVTSDEDFKKNTYYVDEVSIQLKSNVYDINELVAELEDYISNYTKHELCPIYAEYRINTNNVKTAKYAFKYNDFKTGKGVAVEFKLDLSTNSVISITYNDGFNKSAPSYPSQSFDFEEINVYDEYEELISQRISNNENVVLILANSEIQIRSYFE